MNANYLYAYDHIATVNSDSDARQQEMKSFKDNKYNPLIFVFVNNGLTKTRARDYHGTGV